MTITALTEHIKNIDKEFANVKQLKDTGILSEKDFTSIELFYHKIRSSAQSLLAKEREQIKDAFVAGKNEVFETNGKKEFKTSSDYFNNHYTQDINAKTENDG